MRAVERQNNTPAQVREYVEQTVAILNDLDLPMPVYLAVAPTVLNMVASKQIIMQPGPLDGAGLAPGGLVRR